jgi:hypothetical protein
MKTPFKGSFLFLLAVSAITWMLSKTNPDCEDSTLKSIILHGALYGQWLIFGVALGFFVKTKEYMQMFVSVLIGVPLQACIWVWSLWPVQEFGYNWGIVAKMQFGYLLYAPLGFAGVWLGIQLKLLSRTRRYSE